MKHVMVDLETLGRRAGCSVLSIGAVAFDAETGLGEEFYTVVSMKSCEKAGLHTDPDTLNWWEKQSEQAREVLKLAKGKDGKGLAIALGDFNDFLRQFSGVRVWGNGSDFDNAILVNCYAAVGMSQGWEFWNSRCFRTLKALGKEKKVTEVKRHGVYHNALDDAKTQALHAVEIMRKLKIKDL